jgi:hypothetical protein
MDACRLGMLRCRLASPVTVGGVVQENRRL